MEWKSGDPSIVTVDQNGKVTAVAPGKAIITVTSDDGSSATIEVTVTDDNGGGVTPTPKPNPHSYSEAGSRSAAGTAAHDGGRAPLLQPEQR